MSFVAALDQLHALGHELAAPTEPRRKFDLDHMRILARALGDPQRQFPAVLIAGTNGKGSTAATLASILAAAGYRTGLYTSPHLTRITERIRVSNGCHSDPERSSGEEPPHFSFRSAARESAFQPATGNLQPASFSEIPEPDFARLYFRVDDAARALVSAGQLPHHPSFFESLTALAFLYFAGESTPGALREPVDIAILEVGMGGRLDATNIVQPILSVITDIALDHQEYLGSTIAAIAREKAGILRPHGILVTLPQHPEANQAIGEAAIALNVHAISATPYLPDVVRSSNPRVPRDSRVPAACPERSRGVRRGPSRVDPGNATRDPQTLDLEPPIPLNHYNLPLNGETLKVQSPLAGQHQQRNIALAIAAAVELRNHLRNKSNPSPNSSNQESYKYCPDGLRRQAAGLEAGFANPGGEVYRQPTTNNQQPTTGNQQPFSIPNSAIEAGIAATHWPGRLEFIAPDLLLDVAHNPAGAWTLRAAIATLPEDLPRTLIFSCLRDKDLTEMSQILFPLFDSPGPLPSACHSEPQAKNPRIPAVAAPPHALPLRSEPLSLLGEPLSLLGEPLSLLGEPLSLLGEPLSFRSEAEESASPFHLILTPIQNPRAASLDDLLAAARRLSVPAHAAQDPAEALALARRITPPNGLILATGSIYLIGALREAVHP